MAALFESAVATRRAPSRSAEAPDRPATESPGITAGLAYLSRCLRGHRPFAIMTGTSPGLELLLDRAANACASREDLHTVRVTTPPDGVQAFLAQCLLQLGFDLQQAEPGDLEKLLTVFLCHEGARGRRTVILVESTERCGPRVLEFMHRLVRVRAGATPALTFLLAGSPALNRVLGSPGMSGVRLFTRERFDLDRALAWIASPGSGLPVPGPWQAQRPSVPPGDHTRRRIIVMLNGAITARLTLRPGRILIGRSPECALRLDGRFVSRRHCALLVVGNTVAVVDLRSTNGTLVNGQAATRRRLVHGDLVAVGDFRLRYDCRADVSEISEVEPA